MDKLEDLKAAMEHSYRCAPDGTKVYKAEPVDAVIAGLESELAECREASLALIDVVRHDDNCDSLLPGPDLGTSTKPCNCRRP